jgi:UDP-N-acetylmuramoylalanine--D-glutamate ligase
MELGNRVLILGLAREGESLARYFAGLGMDVTVTDVAPAERLQSRLRALERYRVRTALGAHHAELVTEADVLYVSPGVPETNPVYKAAVERDLPIRSMTTLFFDLCPGRIVGITGSSGKTTTTGLIGAILSRAGKDVVVGGNIGLSMLDLLPSVGRETIVVLELSSFQLQLLKRSPHVAVVTNVTPNHLDRHGTRESYIAAKRAIVEHQSAGDWAVLNAADPIVAEFACATPAATRWFGLSAEHGATARDGVAGLSAAGDFTPVLPIDRIPLLGRHNLENVLAAVAASAIFDADPADMRAAIEQFQPAPHRLQTVAERDGVRFIDDSIATSPARALVGLEAIDSPVLLIAGGRDKRLPWDEFAEIARRRVRLLFLIGESAGQIEEAVGVSRLPGDTLEGVVRCASLEEAVEGAARSARPGDTVLLSPACTSYDMFADYEERGMAFTRAVERVYAA